VFRTSTQSFDDAGGILFSICQQMENGDTCQLFSATIIGSRSAVPGFLTPPGAGTGGGLLVGNHWDVRPCLRANR